MTNSIFPTSVAVHDGMMHADDVFSIAIIKILNPHIEVIRTRDVGELLDAGMRVDVGGKYNPDTYDFDHHLDDVDPPRHPEFRWRGETREGPRYSGVGLVWKHYGKECIQRVLSDKDLKPLTDKQLNELHGRMTQTITGPIDIEDNGEQREYFGLNQSKFRPLTINAIIQSLSLALRDEDYSNTDGWKAATVLVTNDFEYASEFAKRIVENSIVRLYRGVMDTDFVQEVLDNLEPGSKTLVMPKISAWSQVLFSLTRRDEKYYRLVEDLLYVVFPVPGKQNKYSWMIQPTKAWNRSTNKLEMKRPMAECLRGKNVDDLKTITGIATVGFVHHTGFIAGTETLEDALLLVDFNEKEYEKDGCKST